MKPLYKQNPSKNLIFVLFGITLLLILGVSIYAVVINTPTFSDGTTEKNTTLSANVNTTIGYIDIPLYSYSNNITIYMEGIPTT